MEAIFSIAAFGLRFCRFLLAFFDIFNGYVKKRDWKRKPKFDIIIRFMAKTSSQFEILLDDKRVWRQQLKSLLRERISEHMPIVGIALEKQEDAEFIRELLQGTSSMGVPFVVFCKDKNDIPFDLYDHTTVIHGNPEKEKNLFSGCDAVVCFSKKAAEQCFSLGIVPIASADCLNVANYDPNRETGNGFIFSKKDSWQVFAAIVRAMETYRFPFDWKCIIKNSKI